MNPELEENVLIMIICIHKKKNCKSCHKIYNKIPDLRIPKVNVHFYVVIKCSIYYRNINTRYNLLRQMY